MGASKRIKQILIEEGLSQKQFAEIVMPEGVSAAQQLRDYLCRDTFKFSTVERWLDALGYDIVFVSRKTGKEFRP